MEVKGVVVHGCLVDDQTRCEHYAGATDVIAIKFHCCGIWYPCHACHAAVADHPASVWPQARFDESAVLCGVCGHQLSIREYLDSGSTCPACRAMFNPGCRLHYHLYFDSGPACSGSVQ